MKRFLIIGAIVCLAGCATTKPQSGAEFSYALPRTDAKLALDLTLKSCDQQPSISVDADMAIVPVSGAQNDRYFVSGAQLASAHIKRGLKLTVNDKDVITGINSENEDQSPEIVANVLKTAATIVTMAGRPVIQDVNTMPKETVLRCLPDVRDAVARAKWLKGEIVSLRHQLVQAPTQNDPALVKQLNRYAKEEAALETGILHVATTAPVTLDTLVGDVNTIDWTQAATLPLDADPFQKWFGPAKPAGGREQLIAAIFGVRWAASAQPARTIRPQPILGRDKTSRECGFAIAVPNTRNLIVVAHGTGAALPAGMEAKKTVVAAQGLDPRSLCLDVGFGESRSVALSFDEFGRTTELAWSSNATAVTGTAAIAGAVSSAKDIRSSLEGPSAVEKQEAEINRLETQQKLNELRACQAVIDAGGFDCKAVPE